MQTETGSRPAPAVEQVVLLDPDGRPTGTAPKLAAHHADTPYHLAFSAHIVDRTGRVLVTRRALAKPTWPGTWTNACCGHPGPGETLRAAVTRRLDHELGLRPRRMAVALPEFSYRATMPDGTVEHELCPVVVVEVAGEPTLNPAEVADHGWLSWVEFLARARRRPASLSPWAVAQAAGLATVVDDPLAWLDHHSAPAPPGPTATSPLAIGLDVGLVVPRTGPSPAAEPAAAAPAPPESERAAGFGAAPRSLPVVDPLAPVCGPVDSLLHDALAARERDLVALDPALAQVTGEIRGLVAAGGKRLRPAFVYWGHRASGARHDDRVLPVAAAVELLHTFALLHDDVMDRSPTRRGRSTAYHALGDLHAASGLEGDAAWFGLSAAVLAGDLAFVWADDLLDRADLAPDATARARRVFTTLRLEVMAGQYLDLRLADDPRADEEDAERVALLKSGRYTVTRPLQLGAALAPVGSETRAAGLDAALSTYGDAVGVAFQLRDDILGLYGDPGETGKSPLDDLRAGKRTLLVLRALRLAPDHDRRVLAHCLGDPDLDGADARRCAAIVADCGALASLEAVLDAHHARALDAVVGLPSPARPALEQLAELAVHRRR